MDRMLASKSISRNLFVFQSVPQQTLTISQIISEISCKLNNIIWCFYTGVHIKYNLRFFLSCPLRGSGGRNLLITSHVSIRGVYGTFLYTTDLRIISIKKSAAAATRNHWNRS